MFGKNKSEKSSFTKINKDTSNEDSSFLPEISSVNNELSSINYSSSLFDGKAKNFKPLFLIGLFSKKIQYAIAGTFIFTGLVGSIYFYFSNNAEIQNINAAQFEVQDKLASINEKSLYLKNIDTLNTVIDKNVLKYNLGTVQNIEDIAFVLDKNFKNINFENVDTIEIADELSKIITFYKSRLNQYIDKMYFVNQKLKESAVTLKEGINNLEIIIDANKKNEFLNDEKKKKLQEIIIEMKNLLIFIDSTSSIEDLKNENKQLNLQISNKIKQVETLFKQYNSIKFSDVSNANLLSWLNKRSVVALNKLNEFSVLFSRISFKDLNLKNDLYIFDNAIKDLKQINANLKEMQNNKQSEIIKIYISLFLLLFGLILFFVIRAKIFEYFGVVNENHMFEINKNLKEIEKDFEIHQNFLKHKISNSKKSRLLLKIIDLINGMWDKNNQLLNFLNDKVKEVKNLENANKKIIENIQEKNEELLTKNQINLNEIKNIKEALDHYLMTYDYYHKNNTNISQKNREIEDYIKQSDMGFKDILSNNEKNLNQLNDVVKIMDEIKFISLDISIFSEEAEILAFNTEILDKKNNNSKNNLSNALSEKLNNLANKYKKSSESLTHLLTNLSKSFELLKLNDTKIETSLTKIKNNNENLSKKISLMKDIENKIHEDIEKLNNLIGKIDKDDIETNIIDSNEIIEEVKKKISSYYFNQSLSEDHVVEIQKNIDLGEEEKK